MEYKIEEGNKVRWCHYDKDTGRDLKSYEGVIAGYDREIGWIVTLDNGDAAIVSLNNHSLELNDPVLIRNRKQEELLEELMRPYVEPEKIEPVAVESKRDGFSEVFPKAGQGDIDHPLVTITPMSELDIIANTPPHQFKVGDKVWVSGGDYFPGSVVTITKIDPADNPVMMYYVVSEHDGRRSFSMMFTPSQRVLID